MYHKVLHILLLSIGLCLKLQAQAIWSADFPFAEDLPSNEMTDIFQDKEGFIWIGTTHGLARYDGYELHTFQTNQTDTLSAAGLSHNYITGITENDSFLWIGTNKGLNFINKKNYRTGITNETQLNKEHIRALCSGIDQTIWAAVNNEIFAFSSPFHKKDHLILPEKNGKQALIQSLFYEESKDRLWICSQNGLYAYLPKKRKLIVFPSIGQNNLPFTFFCDKNGRYWLTTWGDGLWQIICDRDMRRVAYIHQNIISSREKGPDKKFFSLAQDNTFGYIWALSYNNLYAFRYDENSRTLIPVTLPKYINTGKMFTKILKDRDGNLWLSSYDKGTLLTFHTETIQNYTLNEISNTLNWTPNLLTLNQSKNGMFWFIQDRFGLCYYDPLSEKLSLPPDFIRRLTVDSRTTAESKITNGIWVASPHQATISLITYDTNQFKVTRDIKLKHATGYYAPASLIKEMPDNSLWVRSNTHILSISLTDNKIISTPDSVHFTSFTPKDNSSVWATTSNRLYILKRQKGRIICLPQVEISQIRKNEEICLLSYDKNELWAATNLGRILYKNNNRKDFQDFSSRFNSSGTAVLNLLCRNHHLWIVTHNHLIHYNTHNHHLQQYTSTNDNMVTTIFRDQASCLASNGTLYAGGNGGFISVTPPSSVQATISHPLVLTSIRSGIHNLIPSDEFFTNQNNQKELVLPPHTTNLSISFSSLDYIQNTKIRYAYQMEGFDKEWNTLLEGDNTAYYQKLPKGKYRLKVKATDASGVWQSPVTLISITQEPAWYETTWAYLFYILAVLSLIYILLRLYLQRLHDKNKIKLQEALTQTKLDYFTNISHDLLTPLSVISCIGDYWEKQYPAEKRQTNILHHNIYRLKHLLQQILDFRKSENRTITLCLEERDLFTFSHQLCDNYFAPLAEEKGINLNIQIPDGECRCLLDFDKIDKILYNLLSNAIKYTSTGKNIYFSIHIHRQGSRHELEFNIKDEGIGIPEKEQEKIFERFYTGSNGRSGLSNGIGLALAKELVTLHNGRITLKSEQGKGSSFTVILPLIIPDDAVYRSQEIKSVQEYKECLPDDTTYPTEETSPSVSSETNDNEKPAVLLVDDNTHLLELMEKILSPSYRIFTAENGEVALKQLEQHNIDLIVTDVMMPLMDGFTFCRQVKSQIETSHIPVIMLTAKRTSDDQVDSYNAGADSYLAKPFELKVLSARIDNLLQIYKQRQQTFKKEPEIHLASLSYDANDTKFLQDLADCIHAHLDDENFGLEQLSETLHVSKSTIHRKVKAMTGLTPLDFIRNIKLKYACTMLSRHDRTIAEIAYAIGFSSPKYFTRCFKEEFGITPSEYQTQTHKTKS